MANIVTIHDVRYLVDVGYGGDGPCRPMSLESGHVLPGLPGQQLMLEHKRLPQHLDPEQRVWMYSQHRDPEEWTEVYHFIDAEFFPEDFEILNHYAMTVGFFTREVVVQRFLFDDEQKNLSGAVLLFGNAVTRRNGSAKDLLERMESEEQRILALQKYFGITLTEAERNAIRGAVSELKS